MVAGAAECGAVRGAVNPFVVLPQVDKEGRPLLDVIDGLGVRDALDQACQKPRSNVIHYLMAEEAHQGAAENQREGAFVPA